MDKNNGKGVKHVIMAAGIAGLILLLASGATMALSVGSAGGAYLNNGISVNANSSVNTGANPNWGIRFRTWMGNWFHTSNSMNYSGYNSTRPPGFYARMGLAWLHFKEGVYVAMHK
jgi:hypothetical protein